MTGPATTGAVPERRVRVRSYLSLALMSAKAITNYRASFVLGSFGTFFQIAAMFALWRVLLENGPGLEGFTWEQMKAYLLVVFITTALVSAFNDWRMADRIRDGLIAVDLTRPVDFQWARFAETAGRCAVELVMTLSVALGIALVAGVEPPGAAQGALFAVSLAIVVPLKFVVVYGSTLLCFWTQNFLGVMWARTALVSLLSGALVPLVFLPSWLQALAAVLPFVGMTATPAGLFLGRLTGPDAAVALAAQLGWTVGLWWMARFAFTRAVRQVTVHGG